VCLATRLHWRGDPGPTCGDGRSDRARSRLKLLIYLTFSTNHTFIWRCSYSSNCVHEYFRPVFPVRRFLPEEFSLRSRLRALALRALGVVNYNPWRAACSCLAVFIACAPELDFWGGDICCIVRGYQRESSLPTLNAPPSLPICKHARRIRKTGFRTAFGAGEAGCAAIPCNFLGGERLRN